MSVIAALSKEKQSLLHGGQVIFLQLSSFSSVQNRRYYKVNIGIATFSVPISQSSGIYLGVDMQTCRKLVPPEHYKFKGLNISFLSNFYSLSAQRISEDSSSSLPQPLFPHIQQIISPSMHHRKTARTWMGNSTLQLFTKTLPFINIMSRFL